MEIKKKKKKKGTCLQIERERERGVNVPFRFANMVGCTAHFAKKKKEKKL